MTGMDFLTVFVCGGIGFLPVTAWLFMQIGEERGRQKEHDDFMRSVRIQSGD